MNEFSFVDNIPFSIAAGDSLSLPAGSWDYLYMAELVGGDLLAEGSAIRLPFILGRQIRVSKKETGVILLTNRGSSTATGVIYAGSGDVDDRAMVGSVAVTNFPGSPEYSKAGDAFYSYINVAGVATRYSVAQMWNPLGSGRNAVVTRVMGQHATSSAYILLERSSSSAANIFAGNNYAMNKIVGGAVDTTIQQRFDNRLAAAVQSDVFDAAYSNVVLEREEFPLSDPFVIRPGEGLVMSGGAVGQNLIMSAHYYTEAV